MINYVFTFFNDEKYFKNMSNWWCRNQYKDEHSKNNGMIIFKEEPAMVSDLLEFKISDIIQLWEVEDRL